jgi:tRNA(fMet)-specific endonuclease VapC
VIYLLDTDTMTHFYANHARVVQNVARAAGHEVGTTIITKVEMLRGRLESVLKAADTAELLRAQALLLKTEAFLNRILVMPLDQGAGAYFERLRATRGLKKIGRGDLLIASIALARGATLVTRNLRHFRLVPGLTVVNWVD